MPFKKRTERVDTRPHGGGHFRGQRITRCPTSVRNECDWPTGRAFPCDSRHWTSRPGVRSLNRDSTRDIHLLLFFYHSMVSTLTRIHSVVWPQPGQVYCSIYTPLCVGGWMCVWSSVCVSVWAWCLCARPHTHLLRYTVKHIGPDSWIHTPVSFFNVSETYNPPLCQKKVYFEDADVVYQL